MALSDITQKILEDAKSEAESIVLDAKNEAEEIKAQAQNTIEENNKRIEEEASKKELIMERKTKTLIETERKSIILDEKRRVLDKVFADAVGKMASMPKEKAEEIMLGFFTKIQDDEGIVYPAKNQAAVVSSAMKKANKSFTMGEERQDVQGGFVFIGKTTEADFSFDSIVAKEIKPKLELEIAKFLFE